MNAVAEQHRPYVDQNLVDEPAPQATGRRMDRAGASRALTRIARAAGITHPHSPHGLRRTFCTTGLVAVISIRDMQYAMRHADPEPRCATTWLRPTSTGTPPTPLAADLASMSIG